MKHSESANLHQGWINNLYYHPWTMRIWCYSEGLMEHLNEIILTIRMNFHYWFYFAISHDIDAIVNFRALPTSISGFKKITPTLTNMRASSACATDPP